MILRPDPVSILDGLKDFQRATAEYVFDRFYGLQPTHRFLVADEVGLGKTLVARGVIAQAIDFLWDKVRRIDVIYICSNTDIARQNIQRLRIPGVAGSPIASRLTLLPLYVKEMSTQKVNFIAFTPGTSFEQTGGGGIVEERVVLYALLDTAWGIAGQAAPYYVLKDYVKDPYRFRFEVERFDSSRIDPELAQAFVKALAGEPSLRKRFNELCECFCRVDAATTRDDHQRRSRWLSDMRRLLAKVCLRSLEPDLIILDEFQRFRHLLTDDTPAGEIARSLFDYADEETSTRTRVLLLSATPYKMLSLHHEADEDHYRDFHKTLQFLEGDKGEGSAKLLAEYRDALAEIHSEEGMKRLRAAKGALEDRLRLVMARTERLGLSNDRGGMLVERVRVSGGLESDDISGFLGLQKLADVLEAGDLVEYWKSSPFLFNFMDAYQLKQALQDNVEDSDKAKELIHVVRSHPQAFLDSDRIRNYRPISPGNSRLRGLIAEMLDAGAWKLLWVPPSLPYYRLEGPFGEPWCQSFTKRLVFSSWKVVPKTVSAVLSYEAERRMIAPPGKSASNTPEARKRRRGLLRFAWSDGRLTGLPLMSLVYPSVVLAEHCDPRVLCRRMDVPPTAAEMLKLAEEKIRPLMHRLPILLTKDGPVDERWYWVAPILLDLVFHRKETSAWWSRHDLAQTWSGGEEDAESDRWGEHVEEAWKLALNVEAGTEKLGPVPADLEPMLALIGVSAPANAVMRALGRSEGSGSRLPARELQDAAAKTGRAMLGLFNHPEVRELLRALRDEEPYWQRALEYCLSGCLQAVFDEYVHCLRESLGMAWEPTESAAPALAEAITDAITLRTAALRIDNISAPEYARKLQIVSEPMRIRFAMRFGDERGEEETDAAPMTRKERVRAAFNSPFWPFVLVTTSVGQEGLDFHPYCHAVVHWNLPSNPVDLEQREGRVHRYKGHAIRKNVAAAFGSEAIRSTDGDPWCFVFERAQANRPCHESDLVPFWLYPGSARIERHVPCLPFSREVGRVADLKRSLAIYRLVFGQSRQEDLIEYLLARIPESERAAVLAELRIDLSPMRTNQSKRNILIHVGGGKTLPQRRPVEGSKEFLYHVSGAPGIAGGGVGDVGGVGGGLMNDGAGPSPTQC